MPGYSGGRLENPSYEQVCSGSTGHIEVIKVDYDGGQIPFRALLEVFFATHDPTTENRQGNDVGEQYQSVIFYASEDQRREAENFIAGLKRDGVFAKPVVTQVRPFVKFYPAENYHQNYFAKNSGNAYCQVVISPKLEKLKKSFARFLK